MDEFREKVHSIAFRVTKEKALDLPEQVDVIRTCKLEKQAQNIYDKFEKEYIMELEKGDITATNALVKTLRLSQLTGGYVSIDKDITENISKVKLETLKEIIEDVVLETNKKIVIFARFLEEIKAIKKLLEQMKISYSWIAGEVKIEDRAEMKRRFQEDENVKIFVAQIKTAGVGITLTAADTAVFYSLDYSYDTYSQARARIHRIGQNKKCTYIHLICPKTIDELVLKALERKENIANSIVDYYKMGGN